MRSAPAAALEAARQSPLVLFLSQQPLGPEADARFELGQAVLERGGREIYLGLVDGELLRGELSEPVPDLANSARALIAELKEAEIVRIRGRAGTDLTLRVGGRPADRRHPAGAGDHELSGRRDLRRPTRTAPTGSST